MKCTEFLQLNQSKIIDDILEQMFYNLNPNRESKTLTANF